jgi:hypothetical protein
LDGRNSQPSLALGCHLEKRNYEKKVRRWRPMDPSRVAPDRGGGAGASVAPWQQVQLAMELAGALVARSETQMKDG